MDDPVTKSDDQRIADNASAIGSLQAGVAALEGTLADQGTAIAAIQAALADQGRTIAALSDAIKGLAPDNAADTATNFAALCNAVKEITEHVKGPNTYDGPVPAVASETADETGS